MRNIRPLVFMIWILTGMGFGYAQQLTQWEFAQREFGGMWDVWRKISYERGAWSTVTIPHCFNAWDAVDPDVVYFQGEGWYKTEIPIENPFPGGRTVLNFGGVGQNARVYVYNTLVGTHEGGYDKFSVDITEAVEAYQDQQHTYPEAFQTETIPIAVCADNTRDLNGIPSDLSDFNLYGGIYREVDLEYVPAISLDEIHLASTIDEESGKAMISCTSFLYNPGHLVSPITYTLTVTGPDGRPIHQEQMSTSLSSPAAFSFKLDQPSLWSPDSPNLYACEVTLQSPYGIHAVRESFGIRSFHFEKQGPFFLNGERLLLRGTHRHEDHAGLGQAMPNSLIRQEMILMKEMGVNFIRLGHYQQKDYVLDLCDSLGILVWEEIPWCRAGADSQGQRDAIESTLRHLIYQHYNHPSIIIWGLGNEHDWRGEREFLDTMGIRTQLAEMHQLAHDLDDSRKTAIRRCDFAKDLVDVYSPSIWAGWYRGTFPEYRDVSKAEMEEVDHFLHVEWGASHHSLRHSENPDIGIEEIGKAGSADEREGDFLLEGGDARVSKDGDWSTTYACNLIDWHLKEQELMPWLTGTAYWPFKDFSTPLRPENPIPYVNQKGVLERDFTKKESYFVFQSYWTETPMIHIYGSTWDTRWGTEDEEKLIKVYSNCEEVTLWINGKELDQKKRDSQDFPAAGLRWFSPLENGENEVIAVGTKSGQEVRDTLVITYQTDIWGEPDHLTLRVAEQRGDSLLIETRLYDEQQVQCLDASDFVEFGMTGAGRLLDNMGTSTGSRRIGLANGRASIWVQREAGPVAISVRLAPEYQNSRPRADISPEILLLPSE